MAGRATMAPLAVVLALCLAVALSLAQQPISISENFSSQLSFSGLKQQWYVDFDAQLRTTVDYTTGLQSVLLNRTLYTIDPMAKQCSVSHLKDSLEPMWSWLKIANYSGLCAFGEGRRYDAIIDSDTQYSLCAARPNGQTEYLPVQFIVAQDASQTLFVFYDYFPMVPGRGNFTIPSYCPRVHLQQGE